MVLEGQYTYHRGVAAERRTAYNMGTEHDHSLEKEENRVTEVLEKLKRVRIPDKQLERLVWTRTGLTRCLRSS